MKKIIHFHPNGNYSHKFITPLLKAEEEIGFQSFVVNEINPNNSNIRINFQIKKISILRLPLDFLLLCLFFLKMKPDIVFSHNSTSSFLPLLTARLFGVKKIIYFNHGVPFIAYKGFVRLVLTLIEKINCYLADEIITVSKSMKELLLDITKKKVSIIYFGSASGIDPIKFKKKNFKPSQIKKQYNLKINDVIILFVGRANYRKGFYDIIQIWKKYFEKSLNFKLILLGVSEKELKRYYKMIPQNVLAMSFVQNSENFFIIADYLFMNSYHEGMNYSILEAMSSETLVVSNKIYGMSEIIDNDINGYLVENNNHNAFFTNVLHCENNKAEKMNKIKKASETIKKYNRKVFLKYYKIFLQSL